MGLKFYDHTVREGLAVLADAKVQKRLWLGLETGRVSSPFECASLRCGLAHDVSESSGLPVSRPDSFAPFSAARMRQNCHLGESSNVLGHYTSITGRAARSAKVRVLGAFRAS